MVSSGEGRHDPCGVQVGAGLQADSHPGTIWAENVDYQA
jgi:hypothetical protein